MAPYVPGLFLHQPIDRCAADLEGLGDLRRTKPFGLHGADLGSVDRGWTALIFAFRLGLGDALKLTLAPQVGFERLDAFRLPNKILLLVIGHYPRNCWPSGEIDPPDAPLLPPQRMCPRAPHCHVSGRRGSAFNGSPSAPDRAPAPTAKHHAAAPCGSDRQPGAAP